MVPSSSTLEVGGLSPEQVQASLTRIREQIDKQVAWVNKDVAHWEPILRQAVENVAQRRKEQLDEPAALSAALDIPLKSASPDKQVHIPVTRKTVRVARPLAQQEADGAVSDPRMSDAIYEDVLETLRALGNYFERLPRTAARFKEGNLATCCRSYSTTTTRGWHAAPADRPGA